MADSAADLLGAPTERLIGRAVTAHDRFALAVSGGADSMAMLAMAHQCWPGQIEAATVDHGLRAASANEALMVAQWCGARGIPHATLHPAAPISGNLQAAGRSARYALLADWRAARGLDWLLTAHQADDQLETLIMRLNRGSGVGGLSAIRQRQEHILRPLLDMRRLALRRYCADNTVPFVDDPSNEDLRFDRVRLRTQLAALDGAIEPARLNRSIEALGEADSAIEWMCDRLAAERLEMSDGALALDPAGLPREIVRRLLQRMIKSINESAEIPRGPSVDQALVQLFDGRRITLGDCVVTGGDRWIVRRAPPRRSG